MTMTPKEFALCARENCAYKPEIKDRFHRTARALLQGVARSMNLKKSDYDLRSNKAGIAVSGEVTLHSDHLYVQIGQSCMGDRGLILYRTCESRKDYTGGTNNYIGRQELFAMDSRKLADRLKSILPLEHHEKKRAFSLKA